MSPRGRIKSKRERKRAGAKALRTDKRAGTYPRKDGKVARDPGAELRNELAFMAVDDELNARADEIAGDG